MSTKRRKVWTKGRKGKKRGEKFYACQQGVCLSWYKRCRFAPPDKHTPCLKENCRNSESKARRVRVSRWAACENSALTVGWIFRFLSPSYIVVMLFSCICVVGLWRRGSPRLYTQFNISKRACMRIRIRLFFVMWNGKLEKEECTRKIFAVKVWKSLAYNSQTKDTNTNLFRWNKIKRHSPWQRKIFFWW